MGTNDRKCVMVVNEELPVGIIANTAAILGITIGSKIPDLVGKDICDNNGNEHLGIIAIPVPVLKGDSAKIREIRSKLYNPEFEGLTVVDFSDLAQGINDYDEFIEKLGNADEKALNYYGIGICGDKKRVNKLTGSLPLLR